MERDQQIQTSVCNMGTINAKTHLPDSRPPPPPPIQRNNSALRTKSDGFAGRFNHRFIVLKGSPPKTFFMVDCYWLRLSAGEQKNYTHFEDAFLYDPVCKTSSVDVQITRRYHRGYMRSLCLIC